MTRRDRYRAIISNLDLKSSEKLEWVLDHLEALDDTTILQMRLRLKNAVIRERNKPAQQWTCPYCGRAECNQRLKHEHLAYGAVPKDTP